MKTGFAQKSLVLVVMVTLTSSCTRTFNEGPGPSGGCDWSMFGQSASHSSSVHGTCGPQTSDLIKKWSFATKGPITSSCAFENEKCFFGCFDKNLYCIDSVEGSLIWKHETGGTVGSPAVSGGYVCFASQDKKLYCLSSATGETVWEIEGTQNFSSPTIYQSKIYYASIDRNVYA